MTKEQEAAIRRHGQQALAIFPNATERDPVKLCKKLRRLEVEAHGIGLRLCTGPEYPTEDGADEACTLVLHKVYKLLTGSMLAGHESGAVPIFVNRDPRGYALKIRSEWLDKMRDNPKTVHLAAIHRDWGGYGIIAPEIDKDGNN